MSQHARGIAPRRYRPMLSIWRRRTALSIKICFSIEHLRGNGQNAVNEIQFNGRGGWRAYIYAYGATIWVEHANARFKKRPAR
jgi:hypothetical protein